ncbi:MAG: glycosyltransferase [Candidatus Margulisiibacteriota bacterium]|nr:glycosyltransferase [Candidatus Margulisiibacteriota bacterium]
MVQNIGLMMTCNEEDCIEEVMNEHAKYFDKILVLDGSSDRTEEIVRSYDAVTYFIKDSEILDKLPNRKFKDGARQFILEKAQELYGYEGWFTLLHGDEIFYDDPNKISEKAEKAGAEKVNWYAMNFFLHSTDKGKDLESIESLQERIKWYCPGLLEIRQFKNKPGIYYELSEHGRVLPHGIGWKMYKYFPIYKHYPYRSVGQVLKKKKRSEEVGFSASYNQIQDQASCFQDILPNYKVARRFDGSFHEFELDKQGSILNRWLRARKYVPCRIGPFTI